MSLLNKKTAQQSGQVMAEYVLVCVLVAMVLILPIDGKPIYVIVIDAMRSMHQGYMRGLSIYATPF